MSRIVDVLLAHKHLILVAIAVGALVVYVLPIGDIMSPVFAANGGHQSAAGGHPTNENAYKVCKHNDNPKKCYGLEG